MSNHNEFDGRHHEDGLAYGAFKFLDPTTRRVPLSWANARKDGSEGSEQSEQVAKADPDRNRVKTARDGDEDIHLADVHRKWRSRDNRKGRHAISIKPAASTSSQHHYPSSTSTFDATLRGILRMFTSYPYYDVSYLIAISFTLGSVVWVVNSFFVWLPLQDPSTEFPGEIMDAGGISAFIGATIFEIGSVLLMLEAINEDRTGCFGWAVEEVWEEIGEGTGNWRRTVDRGHCRHHHKNRRNLVGKGKDLEEGQSISPSSKSPPSSNWQWYPTLSSLHTHYIHSLGFLACSSQMFGATIFWISGFTALPPIHNRLTSIAAQNGAYWLPQVIGGSGFIASGILFMLETQKKWWLPAWETLGWHIGVWNLMGGIGFTLCGALGFAAANSGAVYQGSLATFWGSWCFLIGSVIQWYESLEKYPVEVEESD